MKTLLLVYPIAPAILCGILNWLYWRRKGFTSVNQLIMGTFLSYAAFYGIIRFFAT